MAGQNSAILDRRERPHFWGDRRKAFAMPDLTDSDILALARAARIEIPAELVADVGYSLNGLLDVLEQAAGAGPAEGLNAVEPLPIVIPPNQTAAGG